jgi:tetrapyrrole methylase family protein / MazG family protein
VDAGAAAGSAASHQLILAGLGPGDYSRLPAPHREILEDPDNRVLVRTLQHPAAEQLAERRPVTTCDDLYEGSETFEEVYAAIVERVAESLSRGPTVYAVPGSPLTGEFAVRLLLERFPGAEVLPAESFVDAILRAVGYDPFQRGLRILNGHELPSPLVLDCPTVIGHLDRPEILAEAAATVSRVLPEGALVTVVRDVGCTDEQIVAVEVDEVPAELAGLRTSLFIDTEPAGLFGLVGVGRRLRAECPWDRAQTHSSLVTHLMEESYELIEAIAGLPGEGESVDYVAYDGVEEELGDVLLQVLFHAAIAAENGAFDIDDVATRLQEKLVRRHPHVFGDVEVADASEVATNWDRIKAEEKGGAVGGLIDGIPAGLPALERADKVQRRAAKVGLDWEGPEPVLGALRAEIEELAEAMEDSGDIAHELGDVLFTVVNLARKFELGPEETLRRAVARFESRVRAMEADGDLAGLSSAELDARWQAAKRADRG